MFTRKIGDLLTEDDYRQFQSGLITNPAAGPLIRGGGGIRKVRVSVGSRGKRGSARVIYYWAAGEHTILLLYAYEKNATADLTPKQIAALARLVKEEFG